MPNDRVSFFHQSVSRKFVNKLLRFTIKVNVKNLNFDNIVHVASDGDLLNPFRF